MLKRAIWIPSAALTWAQVDAKMSKIADWKWNIPQSTVLLTPDATDISFHCPISGPQKHCGGLMRNQVDWNKWWWGYQIHTRHLVTSVKLNKTFRTWSTIKRVRRNVQHIEREKMPIDYLARTVRLAKAQTDCGNCCCVVIYHLWKAAIKFRHIPSTPNFFCVQTSILRAALITAISSSATSEARR